MSFFSNLFGGSNPGLVNGAQAREAVSHGAILLDVRTPMEHEAGTIPGSKNIAVQELAQRLGELGELRRSIPTRATSSSAPPTAAPAVAARRRRRRELLKQRRLRLGAGTS
jgi:rhodanese-related sulfurtransferase